MAAISETGGGGASPKIVKPPKPKINPRPWELPPYTGRRIEFDDAGGNLGNIIPPVTGLRAAPVLRPYTMETLMRWVWPIVDRVFMGPAIPAGDPYSAGVARAAGAASTWLNRVSGPAMLLSQGGERPEIDWAKSQGLPPIQRQRSIFPWLNPEHYAKPEPPAHLRYMDAYRGGR